MLVTVNNETQQLPPASTVADLLRLLKLEGRRIAVERNGELIPRSTWAATVLDEGDRLEIVHAIGGG